MYFVNRLKNILFFIIFEHSIKIWYKKSFKLMISEKTILVKIMSLVSEYEIESL